MHGALLYMKKPQPQSLEEWRHGERIKQKTAADRLGISYGYYSRLERRLLHPHRRLAKAISDQTGVPLEQVLGVA
jgi:transcriptional regulator with XRE-family HTH domain